MIWIWRPSTPPLALISSAGNCAACGIDAPAIACASAITPNLIGSAAMAWLEVSSRATALAPSSPRTDQKTGALDVFIIRFSPRGQLLVTCCWLFYPCLHTGQAKLQVKSLSGGAT